MCIKSYRADRTMLTVFVLCFCLGLMDNAVVVSSFSSTGKKTIVPLHRIASITNTGTTALNSNSNTEEELYGIVATITAEAALRRGSQRSTNVAFSSSDGTVGSGSRLFSSPSETSPATPKGTEDGAGDLWDVAATAQSTNKEEAMKVEETPSPTTKTTTVPSASNNEEDKKKSAVEKLSGVYVTSVRTNEKVELSSFLKTCEKEGEAKDESNDRNMLILGTYAADFNAIEYVQRLRYYIPRLQKEMNINKIGLILNCEKDAAIQLVQMLDLPTDATTATDDSKTGVGVVDLFIDPLGEAGRAFGCGRGWRPDDNQISPYVKLFGMLWGLGAWATLPAVIGGYIGNPFYGQPWIEDALAVGQNKGRWPDTALELSKDGSVITANKFKELPVVGSWERRPLELATLRLQSMGGVSIQNWSELAPKDDALEAGVLTQLGGLVVVDPNTGDDTFSFRDPGICAVCNFEDIFKYSS